VAVYQVIDERVPELGDGPGPADDAVTAP